MRAGLETAIVRLLAAIHFAGQGGVDGAGTLGDACGFPRHPVRRVLRADAHVFWRMTAVRLAHLRGQ